MSQLNYLKQLGHLLSTSTVIVASGIAVPGVVSLIPTLPHKFVETDHDIFSSYFLLLPMILEEMLLVTHERMSYEYWLVA